jgi:hypothetical protein
MSKYGPLVKRIKIGDRSISLFYDKKKEWGSVLVFDHYHKYPEYHEEHHNLKVLERWYQQEIRDVKKAEEWSLSNPSLKKARKLALANKLSLAGEGTVSQKGKGKQINITIQKALSKMQEAFDQEGAPDGNLDLLTQAERLLGKASTLMLRMK